MTTHAVVGRPWMTAMEQQLEALSTAEQVLELSGDKDMALRWQHDIEALRKAETFDWAAMPMRACLQAAATLPHDTMTLAIAQTPPAPAGWWWFQEPMGIQTLLAETPHQADKVVALLWGWSIGWIDPKDIAVGVKPMGARPSLGFTIFVDSEWPSSGGTKRVPASTTTWRWFEGETFHEMLARCSWEYKRVYGPGGRYHGQPALGLEGTLKAVADMTLFFVSACAWLEQKILVESDGPVERHARKRAERERKVKISKVRVVQLRRIVREEREPAEGTAEHVAWTCQWVVSGHWRHQPHGPGGRERKLIYIAPFTKGPTDLPLKETKRVFEVDR